jgi:transcriptional regulator with XRE-family HTH domain
MTVDLKAIREAAGLSRQALADRLGMSPRSGRVTVALTEGRDDWLLSSLSAYFKAAGATAELVVTVAGEEFVFTIA